VRERERDAIQTTQNSWRSRQAVLGYQAKRPVSRGVPSGGSPCLDLGGVELLRLREGALLASSPEGSAFGADCWQGGGSWVSVPSVSLRLSIIDGMAITDRITDPTIATGMATPITIGPITVGPASACGLASEPSSQFSHLSWIAT
jgi:hypothetical protein